MWFIYKRRSPLDKQVDSVINHETIPLAVKTFDCDWNTYRKVQIALARLRHSSSRLAEDYVPLAHSMINLMITSVFPLELMEDLAVKGILEVESPIQRIERLTEMTSEFKERLLRLKERRFGMQKTNKRCSELTK